MRQPWNIAAPSCVLPGTAAENARFLSGKVAEVGLCLYETESCLAYGADDLPPSLARLPLSWHAHLPVDLPWEAGGAAAADTALAVLDKAAFLNPRLAVLHPPGGKDRATLLADFAAWWRTHGGAPVLLENIGDCSLNEAAVAAGEFFGLCLDVGHMLAYGHEDALDRPDVLARVRLVHWSAPGAGDQHLPLTALTPQQRHVARRAARAADVLPMIEVFHWAGIEASMPVLTDLLEPRP